MNATDPTRTRAQRTKGQQHGMMFMGNRLASALDLVGPDQRTLRQKYIVAEPRDCPAGTAEEMRRRGFVGIYARGRHLLFRLPNGRVVLRA